MLKGPLITLWARDCAAGRRLIGRRGHLDDFKVIDNSRGHSTGDEVLLQVVARVRETLREVDGRLDIEMKAAGALRPGPRLVRRLRVHD